MPRHDLWRSRTRAASPRACVTASTSLSRRPDACSICWNQGFVDLKSVEILVLDEADRMLDMGFLPDVRRIVEHIPAERQTILLSATMPQPIAALAGSLLDHPARIRIAPVAATTKLIEQSVCFVEARQKPRLLTRFIKTRSIERALVFTRTKHGADRVVRDLAKSGIRSAAIHGNKSQSNRQRRLPTSSPATRRS